MWQSRRLSFQSLLGNVGPERFQQHNAKTEKKVNVTFWQILLEIHEGILSFKCY